MLEERSALVGAAGACCGSIAVEPGHARVSTTVQACKCGLKKADLRDVEDSPPHTIRRHFWLNAVLVGWKHGWIPGKPGAF